MSRPICGKFGNENESESEIKVVRRALFCCPYGNLKPMVVLKQLNCRGNGEQGFFNPLETIIL
jgi:hypothetical protein